MRFNKRSYLLYHLYVSDACRWQIRLETSCITQMKIHRFFSTSINIFGQPFFASHVKWVVEYGEWERRWSHKISRHKQGLSLICPPLPFLSIYSQPHPHPHPPIEPDWAIPQSSSKCLCNISRGSKNFSVILLQFPSQIVLQRLFIQQFIIN